MTDEEKQSLCQSIEKLPEDQATLAFKIIQDGMEMGRENQGDCGEGELELDIDDLPTQTLRSLQRYVGRCLGPPSAV